MSLSHGMDAMAIISGIRRLLLSVGLVGLGMVSGGQVAVSPIFAADLVTIRERGYLVVAVKDNRPPLGFRQASGELEGFEIDLAIRLAEAILGDGEALVLQPVTNPNRLPAVLEGEVDMAIAGIAMTPERMRLVSFSLPYYLDGTALVTARPDVRTLADLPRRPVAVIDGSAAVAALRHQVPTADLVPVSSYQEALALLETGGADAFAGDLTVLAGWVQEYPAYHLLPTPLSAVPLAVAMPKGVQHHDLHRLVSATIQDGHDSGWLEERATVWGLP